jgi:peptidoglycan hydrolase-like protein with peptidoglycan-binding domain
MVIAEPAAEWCREEHPMTLAYQKNGLTMTLGEAADAALVRELQRDLRRLGYLRSGIDGVFGRDTDRALRAIRYDLINNDGGSSQNDGRAPVAMTDYNRGRIADASGGFDQNLAACIADLLADDKFVQLPSAADPVAANKHAIAAILSASSSIAPTPFLVAMVMQESGGQHFRVPRGNDQDNFVVVGLDRAGGGDAVTSRGYGIGQYTLFHHPPQPKELRDFIADPVGNVAKAYAELKHKFDRFVAGPDSRARDRDVEHPHLALRDCRYLPADPLRMRDCVRCAKAARRVDIHQGMPVYAGAATSYQPDQYYSSASYAGVPDRADFPCDWPYAARRYNGEGNDSYHYQARILLNLLAEQAPADA